MSCVDPPVPISALQHWVYCPRQCALIHLEGAWAENRLTAEGRILHGRSDSARHETRGAVKILRGIELAAGRYGLYGRADVVEIRAGPNGTLRPYPVEYKRGGPKPHRADEVQLCAQALCLEEMFGLPVAQGALFYGRTRRRKRVVFDERLRALTEQTIADVRKMLAAHSLPPPVYERARCEPCSLKAVCLPRCRRVAADWFAHAVVLDGVPE